MESSVSESRRIAIVDVVFDASIYPRSELDLPTVARYAEAYEAGERLPPIVLEEGTNALLDGRHRLQARISRGQDDVEVIWHHVPDGVSRKLYAAALSARNGLPVPDESLKLIAREAYTTGSETTINDVARWLCRARQTVEAWVYDLRQERRNAEARELKTRRMIALLLREIGWTQQRIGDLLGVDRSAISRIVCDAEDGITHTLDESVLRAAIQRLPEDVVLQAEEIAERWREERLFSQWSEEEQTFLNQLRKGETVVVNRKEGFHASLWRWAEQAGLGMSIDRSGEWGNPFRMPDDGDRDECCDFFERYYYPHKRSLQHQVRGLKGKALGCWCAPLRCHGDFLKREAEE